jgi:cysteate synthase
VSFKPTSYQLVSAATGTRRPDEGGWTLKFADEEPSLIRAEYAEKQLTVREDYGGLYCFADWLPIRRILDGSASPVTYRSEHLAEALELENLWITFNGWWPERNAAMKTGTFKECEAYSVCARMGDDFDKVLVVASAGNTARAFARVCSDNRIPLLLFVPEDNLNALWFDSPIDDCVKLICAEAGGDYFDAIRMSNAAVAGSDLFIAEGGAANVARRDGMATTVLSAVTEIGRIPDAYFQAVGSGTGAIAAWEAAMRFEADGRFGPNNMKLVVSQNLPFTPMADTLAADSREFLVTDDETARAQVAEVRAKVLTNRRPPWGVPGGLYDALKATGGTVLSATNEEAVRAGDRFAQLEGIDVSDAAGVAVASLFKAVEAGTVEKNAIIMLNITGGGMNRFKEDHEIVTLEPSVILPLDSSDMEITNAAAGLFDK